MVQLTSNMQSDVSELLQLEAAGEEADKAKILSDIEARDKRDRERASSPLVPAADATLLDSTEMSIEEVFEYAMSVIDKAALQL